MAFVNPSGTVGSNQDKESRLDKELLHNLQRNSVKLIIGWYFIMV